MGSAEPTGNAVSSRAGACRVPARPGRNHRVAAVCLLRRCRCRFCHPGPAPGCCPVEDVASRPAERAFASGRRDGASFALPIGMTGVAGERSRPKGLLEVVRETMRAKHYSPRTEEAYVGWIRRFIRFHGMTHPRQMGEAEVSGFLSSLAVEGRVAASTQNQALSALIFLYARVLGLELDWLQGLVRAKRPVRIPVVLTQEEVRRLLSHLSGTEWLVASLLYGAGLRLLEGLELRIKDVDLAARELRVRDGKGRKDRVTVVPVRPSSRWRRALR